MTALSDTHLPLSCKQTSEIHLKEKESMISRDEAVSRDEKPPVSWKKNKSKRSPQKRKKQTKQKNENLPPILLPELANMACSNEGEDNEHASIESVQDEENSEDENSKRDEESWKDENVNNIHKKSCENVLINLVVGDFIAIKVPEKHYIKGQPCTGKVVAEVDERNQVLVHYYTGTYNGLFRPMMSRSSAYLRKVSVENVLCKFEMQSDGSLSPRTAIRLRQIVERPSS